MVNGLVIAHGTSDVNTAAKTFMPALGARVNQCSLLLNNRENMQRKMPSTQLESKMRRSRGQWNVCDN